MLGNILRRQPLRRSLITAAVICSALAVFLLVSLSPIAVAKDGDGKSDQTVLKQLEDQLAAAILAEKRARIDLAVAKKTVAIDDGSRKRSLFDVMLFREGDGPATQRAKERIKLAQERVQRLTKDLAAMRKANRSASALTQVAIAKAPEAPPPKPFTERPRQRPPQIAVKTPPPKTPLPLPRPGATTEVVVKMPPVKPKEAPKTATAPSPKTGKTPVATAPEIAPLPPRKGLKLPWWAGGKKKPAKVASAPKRKLPAWGSKEGPAVATREAKLPPWTTGKAPVKPSAPVAAAPAPPAPKSFWKPGRRQSGATVSVVVTPSAKTGTTPVASAPGVPPLPSRKGLKLPWWAGGKKSSEVASAAKRGKVKLPSWALKEVPKDPPAVAMREAKLPPWVTGKAPVKPSAPVAAAPAPPAPKSFWKPGRRQSGATVSVVVTPSAKTGTTPVASAPGVPPLPSRKGLKLPWWAGGKKSSEVASAAKRGKVKLPSWALKEVPKDPPAVAMREAKLPPWVTGKTPAKRPPAPPTQTPFVVSGPSEVVVIRHTDVTAPSAPPKAPTTIVAAPSAPPEAPTTVVTAPPTGMPQIGGATVVVRRAVEGLPVEAPPKGVEVVKAPVVPEPPVQSIAPPPIKPVVVPDSKLFESVTGPAEVSIVNAATGKPLSVETDPEKIAALQLQLEQSQQAYLEATAAVEESERLFGEYSQRAAELRQAKPVARSAVDQRTAAVVALRNTLEEEFAADPKRTALMPGVLADADTKRKKKRVDARFVDGLRSLNPLKGKANPLRKGFSALKNIKVADRSSADGRAGREQAVAKLARGEPSARRSPSFLAGINKFNPLKDSKVLTPFKKGVSVLKGMKLRRPGSKAAAKEIDLVEVQTEVGLATALQELRQAERAAVAIAVELDEFTYKSKRQAKTAEAANAKAVQAKKAFDEATIAFAPYASLVQADGGRKKGTRLFGLFGPAKK